MRTVYDRNGKPRIFKQDIDALHAVQAGKLFEVPPKGVKIERAKVNKDNMTAQQLVDHAKKEFDVDLDPLTRLDLLVNVIDDLENPKEFEKPQQERQKTIKKRSTK